jgi:hypothetical protein
VATECDSPRFSLSLSRYNSQWFIELVQDLGHEIWVGDPAQIEASYVRKQKTDKLDAGHILKLVVKAASAPVDAEPRATRSAAVSARGLHVDPRRRRRLLIERLGVSRSCTRFRSPGSPQSRRPTLQFAASRDENHIL